MREEICKYLPGRIQAKGWETAYVVGPAGGFRGFEVRVDGANLFLFGGEEDMMISLLGRSGQVLRLAGEDENLITLLTGIELSCRL